jgi:purine-cytosine permease-like protein
MADKRKFEHEIDLEFTHEPVPKEYRKSFAVVAGTWFGYPMSLSNAIFGGLIVGYLGLKDGLLAILIGALLLFAYVGPLSYRAGKTGMNFPLMAKTLFWHQRLYDLDSTPCYYRHWLVCFSNGTYRQYDTFDFWV